MGILFILARILPLIRAVRLPLSRTLGKFFLFCGLDRNAFEQFRFCAQLDPNDGRNHLLMLESLLAAGCHNSALSVVRAFPRDARRGPSLSRVKERLVKRIAAQRVQTARRGYNAFDAFIEFVAVVRAMILRDLLLHSKVNLFQSLTAPIRVAANTLGHAYLYLLVIRQVPAGTSFLTFCMPVFIIWQAFDHAFYYADPHLHRWRSQDQITHMKWLHAFVAQMAWDMVSTAFVCGLIFIVYDVTGETMISRPLTFDSLPLFLAMYMLAAVMGLGTGAIHHYLKTLLPLMDVIGKLASFVLYLTSGVYDTYATEPVAMRQVFSWNPLLPVMEYSRKAFAGNYYLANLNIWYSIGFTAASLVLGLMFLKKMVNEVDS